MTFKNTYEDEEDKLAQDAAAPFRAQQSDGFDDSVYRESKPVYDDPYGERIGNLLDGLENREPFTYDPESDPAFLQYRDQYRREGRRAVEDTLASAASHAGGMNSYAVTAAQQAGDYYNAQLMDALPDLIQLAYERYQADYEGDLDVLEILRRQETEAYDRYQDSLDDWYRELENAYQQYRDSEEDRRWQEEFDYEKEQDAKAYEKWLAEQERSSAGQGQQTAPPQTQPQSSAAAPYTGTDYYQDAINAAVRGDRATAEAALRKREEKMADPAYGGTGGGTDMDAARQYIEGLLASSEGVGISESEAAGMMSKSEWKENRSAGGIAASYATYEDYVSDYLRYLTEG